MAISLKVLGSGFAFLLTLAVGRMLGAHGAGLYFLAISITSIAGTIARLGLENTVLRFVAYFHENNDWGQIRGVLRYALIWVGSVSLTFSITIIFFAEKIESFFLNVEGMTLVLIAVAFSIVFFNLMTLFSEALKGLGMSSKALLVGSVVYPLCALVVVYPLISMWGVIGSGIAYMTGTIFASIVVLIIWERALSGQPSATQVNRNELRASSRPLWVSMIIIQAIQPWVPILLLGIWATPSDAGVLGAATRIALLISFILVAINSVLAPQFTVLFKHGEYAKIEKIAGKCALFVTTLTTPIFIICIFSGDLVMSIFGMDFSTAGNILAILAVGQFVNAFTGPVGLILMMGGREKDMRTLSLISVIVVVLMALLLIPNYGAIGAAIASSTGLICTSLISVFMVRLRFKIRVFSFFFNSILNEVRNH